MLWMIQCLKAEEGADNADSNHTGSPLVSSQTYQGHCNTILIMDLWMLLLELSLVPIPPSTCNKKLSVCLGGDHYCGVGCCGVTAKGTSLPSIRRICSMSSSYQNHPFINLHVIVEPGFFLPLVPPKKDLLLYNTVCTGTGSGTYFKGTVARDFCS